MVIYRTETEVELLLAVEALLANRVPIPDKDSDYVARYLVDRLRAALREYTGNPEAGKLSGTGPHHIGD